MMVARFSLCAALLLSTPGLATAKQAKDVDMLRAQAQQDCFDDVQRLCGDSIPDEDRIKVCMKHYRAQLSPQCRKDFDQGM